MKIKEKVLEELKENYALRQDVVITSMFGLTIDLTLAEVKKVIGNFFRGKKVSLNKKSSILPKKIQDYTNEILNRLEEELKQKLGI